MLEATGTSDQGLAAPSVPTAFPSEINPIGCHDERAQRAWEHEQVNRGVRRYRDSLTKANADGTRSGRGLEALEPGQRIAEDLIGPLVERIRQAQQAAFEVLTNKAVSTPSDYTWGLALLPAETFAACTVLHALSRYEPGPFTACAIALGTRVQHEWEFQNWKANESAAEKERRERGDEAFTPNLFKLMLHRNKDQVNDRVFTKWSKKAPLFCKGNWTTVTRAQVGTALLTLLVESSAWFEVTIQCINNRQVRIFKMTDLGLAWVSDRHSQNELMRPYLLPMICEPRDFEYSEVAGN
jgi:hypothetical protein